MGRGGDCGQIERQEAGKGKEVRTKNQGSRIKNQESRIKNQGSSIENEERESFKPDVSCNHSKLGKGVWEIKGREIGETWSVRVFDQAETLDRLAFEDGGGCIGEHDLVFLLLEKEDHRDEDGDQDQGEREKEREETNVSIMFCAHEVVDGDVKVVRIFGCVEEDERADTGELRWKSSKTLPVLRLFLSLVDAHRLCPDGDVLNGVSECRGCREGEVLETVLGEGGVAELVRRKDGPVMKGTIDGGELVWGVDERGLVAKGCRDVLDLCPCRRETIREVVDLVLLGADPLRDGRKDAIDGLVEVFERVADLQEGLGGPQILEYDRHLKHLRACKATRTLREGLVVWRGRHGGRC